MPYLPLCRGTAIYGRQCRSLTWPKSLTLAIDIGGTKLKAGLLDRHGTMIAGPNRVGTPPNPTPQKVVDALVDLAMPLGAFDRVSVGFPGVVRNGQVLTAPNLGTPAWRHFPLTSSLTDKLGKPTRMLNDAEVQELGVITTTGLECVITLCTGMGFGLFQDGRLAPHLELASTLSTRARLTTSSSATSP
jgi:polyphosphate glucokinase